MIPDNAPLLAQIEAVFREHRHGGQPPALPPDIHRLSVSSMDGFWRCPERWRRQRIGGEWPATSGDQLFGRTVHQAVAWNYGQKIDSHADRPVNDMREYTGTAWDEVVEHERGLTEIVWGDKPNTLQSDAIAAVVGRGEWPGYHQTLAPTVQPTAAERRVEVVLPSGIPFVAVLDVEDATGLVTDVKTGKRRRNQSDIDKSEQATAYMYVRRVEGNPAAGFRWHTAIRKRQPEHQELITERGDAAFVAFARRVDDTVALIRWLYDTRGPDGPWPGAAEGAWWCAPAQCGFWPTCSVRPGRR